DQLAPSHRSVRDTLSLPSLNVPTAQAPEGSYEATPVREFAVALGSGLGTTCQAEPSQCSIRVRVPPAGVSAGPTAHRSFGPEPEAPCRRLSPVVGLGVGTTVHAEPSQCRAMVRYTPCPSTLDPTAHTSFAAATARSSG